MNVDFRHSLNSESPEDLTIERYIFCDTFLKRLELMNILQTAFWKTAEVLEVIWLSLLSASKSLIVIFYTLFYHILPDGKNPRKLRINGLLALECPSQYQVFVNWSLIRAKIDIQNIEMVGIHDEDVVSRWHCFNSFIVKTDFVFVSLQSFLIFI